jgi:hypothetical protein
MNPEQLRDYNTRLRQLRASPAALVQAVRSENKEKKPKSEKTVDVKSKASQYL